MSDAKTEKVKVPAGWTQTFTEMQSTLKRFLRKYVGQDDVEDLIGETYLRTFERFGNKQIEYPKAFLFKTARNMALNHIARHEYRFAQSMEENADSTVYLASEALESQIEAQEKFQIFCNAVEKLSPKCRQAFVLKRVYGQSTKAIAKEMGISISTAEKHIAKGLMLCAQSLTEKGYDLKGLRPRVIEKVLVNENE